MTAKTLEKQQTLNINVIFDFFNQFPKWCGKSAVTPTINDVEKYLAKNFQLHDNGELVAKSSANYLDRIKSFQKKYSNFVVSKPLEQPIVHGNQVVLYYKLDLTTHTNQHKEVFLINIITIENGKMTKAIEVTSDRSSSNWDK